MLSKQSTYISCNFEHNKSVYMFFHFCQIVFFCRFICSNIKFTQHYRTYRKRFIFFIKLFYFCCCVMLTAHEVYKQISIQTCHYKSTSRIFASLNSLRTSLNIFSISLSPFHTPAVLMNFFLFSSLVTLITTSEKYSFPCLSCLRLL